MNAVERIDLAPDLSISRVLTGLWQIADMERDGRQRRSCDRRGGHGDYVAAGLTTFDMADHYGSAEADRRRATAPATAPTRSC